ncbi:MULTISPECIES: choice-of-anchor M domain-containing protein [Actinosynnema]|uniref:choice-of-anchor M domain-containing protein n=1 Tax=Actinosynnema TaxID=40566 RepID=UPI0020A399C8|nr:choice-of-anchor M domain-containing protein [Actinosynnema pretiosum]MCP2098560.1 surface-anchored protein [Actinosynnema pretiosum]
MSGLLRVLLVALLLGVATAPPASAAPLEIRDGHVDIGPALVDGAWQVRVEDDSTSPPTWRDPAEVVLRIGDAAKAAIPADPAYAFLGQAGETVHLMPQTRRSGVLWIGWNTRHESVLAQRPEAISLSLHDVEGPGRLRVYLDYGGFRPPKTVWDNEELAIEAGAHTHANWAFTAPGEYRARFTARITPRGGEAVEATSTLRFLVGDATSASAEEDEPFPWAITGAVAALSLLAAAFLLKRRR